MYSDETTVDVNRHLELTLVGLVEAVVVVHKLHHREGCEVGGDGGLILINACRLQHLFKYKQFSR